MEVYGRGGGVAPFILNLGTRLRRVVNFTPWPPYPQEGMPVPIDYKAGWAPQSVWTILKEEEKNKK